METRRGHGKLRDVRALRNADNAYPGETTKKIIEVRGDSKRESNETFYLDLFGLSSNAPFTKHRSLGTIVNDD